MATVRCKNTDGKGNVSYVDYEVEDYIPEDEEAEIEDYEEQIARFGV